MICIPLHSQNGRAKKANPSCRLYLNKKSVTLLTYTKQQLVPKVTPAQILIPCVCHVCIRAK